MFRKYLLASSLILGALSIVCASIACVAYAVTTVDKIITAKENISRRVKDYVIEKF